MLPYGLVYELLIVHQIPVQWVISDTKLKDGVDFNATARTTAAAPSSLTPAGEVEVYVDTSTLPEFVRQTYDLDRSLDHRTRAFVFASQTTVNVDFGYVEEIEVAVVKIGPSTVVESGTDITNEVTVTAPGQQYEASLANSTSTAAITVQAPAPKKLAFTGQNLGLLIALAAMLVLAGYVLLSLGRRRPLRT